MNNMIVTARIFKVFEFERKKFNSEDKEIVYAIALDNSAILSSAQPFKINVGLGYTLDLLAKEGNKVKVMIKDRALLKIKESNKDMFVGKHDFKILEISKGN